MRKRKAIAVLMALLMALLMTACGKFTCGLCGQEKSGKSYKKTVLGQEIVICKDCQEGINEIKDLFK